MIKQNFITCIAICLCIASNNIFADTIQELVNALELALHLPKGAQPVPSPTPAPQPSVVPPASGKIPPPPPPGYRPQSPTTPPASPAQPTPKPTPAPAKPKTDDTIAFELLKRRFSKEAKFTRDEAEKFVRLAEQLGHKTHQMYQDVKNWLDGNPDEDDNFESDEDYSDHTPSPTNTPRPPQPTPTPKPKPAPPAPKETVKIPAPEYKDGSGYESEMTIITQKLKDYAKLAATNNLISGEAKGLKIYLNRYVSNLDEMYPPKAKTPAAPPQPAAPKPAEPFVPTAKAGKIPPKQQSADDDFDDNTPAPKAKPKMPPMPKKPADDEDDW